MGNKIDERKLIEQNNLSSKRWKMRRIRQAADRNLLRSYREYRNTVDLINNLGYEDLPKPVQLGYKRLFVLTEDTKHKRNAEMYQRILDTINTIWYSPVKTFQKPRKRKISKWRYRNRKEQTLRELTCWEFDRHKFTDDEQALFTKVDYYDYCFRRWATKYVFKETWRFVLRVRPNIITQVKRKDLELEQRRDELERKVWADNGRAVKVLWGGNTSAWSKFEKRHTMKEKYRYGSLRNIPAHTIYQQYSEEQDYETSH